MGSLDWYGKKDKSISDFGHCLEFLKKSNEEL